MNALLHINIEAVATSFLQKYPNHTVFLFCESEDLSETVLALAKEWKNLMLVIHYDKTTPEICETLKENKTNAGFSDDSTGKNPMTVFHQREFFLTIFILTNTETELSSAFCLK